MKRGGENQKEHVEGEGLKEEGKNWNRKGEPESGVGGSQLGPEGVAQCQIVVRFLTAW